jgi:hypothetical protein
MNQRIVAVAHQKIVEREGPSSNLFIEDLKQIIAFLESI